MKPSRKEILMRFCLLQKAKPDTTEEGKERTPHEEPKSLVCHRPGQPFSCWPPCAAAGRRKPQTARLRRRRRPVKTPTPRGRRHTSSKPTPTGLYHPPGGCCGGRGSVAPPIPVRSKWTLQPVSSRRRRRQTVSRCSRSWLPFGTSGWARGRDAGLHGFGQQRGRPAGELCHRPGERVPLPGCLRGCFL